jgi:hypothetical protein
MSENRNPFWFLFNIYGWLIVIMSVITALIIELWWIVLLGVIGYQTVLFVELTWGGALGKTGRIRLARAEQENRELRAEKARLIGTIREQETRLEKSAAPGEHPPEAEEPAENIPN